MEENNENNVTTVETETETTYYDDNRPSFGGKLARAGVTIVIWEGAKFVGSKIMNRLGWRKKKSEDKDVVKKEKTKETKTETKSESKDEE